MAPAAATDQRRTTGHFSLLHCEPVILHAADWEIYDPQAALWSVLEALPVRRSFLVLRHTWTLEHQGTRDTLLAAVSGVRDRFEHVDVVVLAKTPAELEALLDCGQPALDCSPNALVRDDFFYPIPGRQPRFDAIYDGKWADYKRHDLAGGVASLALIAYPLPESCTVDYYDKALRAVAHAHWFTKPWVTDPVYLSNEEVNAAYNEARVGLILSAMEGGSFASIQYLLAGLPVVTTRNMGGRDQFLSPRVARWADDEPGAVAAAVAELVALDIDPGSIRAEVLAKIGEHRGRFLQWIRTVIEEEGGRVGRWAAGWPPDLPNKLSEPRARVDDVLHQVGVLVGSENLPEVVVSEEDRRRLEGDGFLVVDRALVTPGDLGIVRGHIEGLLARFHELGSDNAYDLGDVKVHDGQPQIPEIGHALKLEPRLAETAAFAACRGLAIQLLGRAAHCVYDHVIVKPPGDHTDVGWHQDLAYAPEWTVDEVHIWLALQDVDETNGCMRFIPSPPGAHLRSHHKRGHNPLAHALVTDDVDPAHAVSCPLGAGMATVHRPATLHSTGPNTTDETRLAWIFHFVGDV